MALFEIEGAVAGRQITGVQDLSKSCHFRAQRYTGFGVPTCYADVAEEARIVCGQWRHALLTLVGGGMFTGFRFASRVTGLGLALVPALAGCHT